ncbi:hypothetical protein UFOVP965_114 [uncultured Caudovirales phage]|uniref:Uncharacterized protein n=1 Tax=uncultured Caudovirales phage TaxID=2100421 RepID=A0A6J5R534_9CAUD|nr:hypothetical protein UFOVP965_114 [uncultured Caudovirales phage]CAB4179903.1 hypothetical protein UFOVP1035_110 [uncultured Caudovirales phage]CAB4188728.1 hypothetical protein UFOVP1181_69 [uncultured Caudovirales phage]
MVDPALGRSRAQRALGENYPKSAPKKKAAAKKVALKKPRNTESNNIRNENNGMFAGPKPTFGRYNVSEQSADILNRSLNKKTR